MDQQQLQAEMERLIEAGDMAAFNTFAVDHFAEFPEEVQSKLLMSFTTDTLEREAGNSEIAALQKEGMDIIEKIEALKASAKAQE